jgi:hypothetical protein
MSAAASGNDASDLLDGLQFDRFAVDSNTRVASEEPARVSAI